MKKILSYAIALGTIIFAASACTSAPEPEIAPEGHGAVQLKISTDNTVDVIGATRASVDEQSYVVKIYNSQGLIYMFEGLSQIPEKLWLKSDAYTVKAYAGDKSLISYTSPYYEGSNEFTIGNGGSQTVGVTCYIANTLFTVGFDQSLKDNFSSYEATVIVNDTTKMTFDASTEGVTGYVTLPEGQTSVKWSFDGIANDNTVYSKSGTITPVKTKTKYQLNYRYVVSDKGEVTLNIEVDDTTEDIDKEIDIFQRPEITPLGFDINQVQSYTGTDFIFSITSSSEISSILLKHSSLGEGLEVIGNAEIGSYGITLTQQETGKVKLTIGSEMIAALPGGLNQLYITVTDSQNKSQTAILKISLSGINEIAPYDAWANKINVSAMITDKNVSEVQFGYRLAGSEDQWTRIPASGPDAENLYTATFTGLAPQTEYECVAFVNGNMYGTPATATTEAAPELPNGGFEDWYQDTAWYPYSQGGTEFWGTGNPMSTILGSSYNITTPEESPRTGSEGTKCAKLQSRYVGVGAFGKIAAGNMFTGRSVGMSSGTNGIVAFGQSWTSRPKALKGWYKATAGTIDYVGSNSPVAKGDKDVYQIFVALTDWSEPHNVDTADQGTFFNPNTDSGIIAYGEIRSSEEVADWTQFTIDLEYRSLTRIPTYIVIVATASAYGDYFSGSTSSVMYIDDFELEY